MRAPVVLPVLAALLSSCAVFGSGAVRSSWRSGAAGERQSPAILVLDRVEADAGAGSERIARNAGYIAELLLSRKNQALDPAAGLKERPPAADGGAAAHPRETLRVRIALGEATHLRGFTPVTTVSAEITLHRGDSPEAVVRSLRGVDTRESLASYPFLYRFLEKALGDLP